jgi:hypothetical protein
MSLRVAVSTDSLLAPENLPTAGRGRNAAGSSRSQCNNTPSQVGCPPLQPSLSAPTLSDGGDASCATELANNWLLRPTPTTPPSPYAAWRPTRPSHFTLGTNTGTITASIPRADRSLSRHACVTINRRRHCTPSCISFTKLQRPAMCPQSERERSHMIPSAILPGRTAGCQ